ncbi:MAG: hypothetical protein GY716_20495 [bacterium]|nr:hypothetical protein [bacterium]
MTQDDRDRTQIGHENAETETDLSALLQRLDFELDEARRRLQRDLPNPLPETEPPRERPGS